MANGTRTAATPGKIGLRQERLWNGGGADDARRGQAYAATSRTEQTLDTYGNVTQSRVFDSGNLSTPARTYNYTYVSSPSYVSKYIRNRVQTAAVTGAGSTVTLASNTYDAYGSRGLTDRPGITAHDSAYGTLNFVRGNVTQSTTPGAVRNTAYDIGGMPGALDDGNGHTLQINLSSATHFAAPDSLVQHRRSTRTA